MKNEIKRNLKRILNYYGAKQGAILWDCVPSRHENPRDNLSIKGDVCCCHCGLKGDSLSVIAEMECLDIKRDFPKIIKKGKEILNLNDEEFRGKPEPSKYIKPRKQCNNNKYDLTNIITDYKNNHNCNYVYFYKRNIRNKSLLDKYKIITCNPLQVINSKLLPYVNNLRAYRNIIPVWENGKIVNCILRRDDYFSKEGKKILNLKGLPLKIWNSDYLRQSEFKDVFFVTEGIFDALSFEDIGLKGVALNSVVMINKFITIIKENLAQLKKNECSFLIVFDSDQAGRNYREKLKNMLGELKLNVRLITLKDYKDVNEFYVNDGQTLARKSKMLVEAFKK